MDEFAALPQTQISNLPDSSVNPISSQSGISQSNSSVEVKSAETTQQTKFSDVKITEATQSESLEKSKSSIPEMTAPKMKSCQNRDQSEILVKSDESGINQSQEKSEVRIVSQKTSRNQTLSSLSSSGTDSLTRKVNRVLQKSDHMMAPLSMSALESIEVKSVSSTNSSKFAAECEKFQSTSYWNFVKKYIPENEQSGAMLDMVSKLSKSTDISSMSSEISRQNIRQKKSVNQSGKSVLSEQRFVDGLVFSPMGSHKRDEKKFENES